MKRFILILMMLIGFVMFAAAEDSGTDAGITAFDFARASYDAGEYEDALMLLQPLLEAGDSDAQFLMGLMCYYGRGVEASPEDAAGWFRQAAEQGDMIAQYNLGFLYQSGDGVEQSNEMAVRYYRMSAEQGYDSAQYQMGLMYYYGDGVEQSDE